MSRRPLLRGLAVASLAAAFAVAAGAAKPKPAPHPLTDPLPVSACASCQQRTPELAGGSAADFLATWSSFGEFRVFRRVFDADGNADVDHEVTAGTQISLTGAAALDDGWVFGYFNPGQVMVERLDGAGAAHAPAVRVNAPEPGDDDHGAGIAAGPGGVVVTFSRTKPPGEPAQVVAQLLASDLTPAAAPAVVGEAPPYVKAPVCMLAGGGAAVAWSTVNDQSAAPDDRRFGAAVRRLGGDGNPAAPARTLAAATTPGTSTGVAIACGADGGFAVAWHQASAQSGLDVLWQRFDKKGKAVGKTVLLSSGKAGDQQEPALLALPGGGYLAAWQSDAGGQSAIVGRRFAANGKASGADFVLHAAADGETAADPRLASMPGTGRLVLAWNEGGRGWVQVFGD